LLILNAVISRVRSRAMNGEETNYRRVVRVRPTKKHCHDEEACRTYTDAVDEEYNPYGRRESIRNDDTYDIFVKVMLLGDSGVGKTCILMQFRDGLFLSGNFISTVGIDFRNKVVTVDQTRVKLQIWDTAGQERFRSVTHAYYRDAHALLLLYDVTNKTSFDNIRAWLSEIREYAQDDVVIMLLGECVVFLRLRNEFRVSQAIKRIVGATGPCGGKTGRDWRGSTTWRSWRRRRRAARTWSWRFWPSRGS
jgi:small GTP-binding protein